MHIGLGGALFLYVGDVALDDGFMKVELASTILVMQLNLGLRHSG